MGKSSPKVRVTQYFMSLQYGICHGIVDKFISMKVNEKLVLLDTNTGPNPVITIDESDLFGGIKKEGGLQGRIAFQQGTDTQLLDSFAASKVGDTPENLPGYRGIATAFFTEKTDAGSKGFYWSANQPYVPPVAFRVTRIDNSWRSDIAGIPGESEKQGIAVCFALDLSSSMGGGLGQVWLVARDAIIGAVADLRDSAYPDTIDIRIVGWNSGYTEMVRRNCTPADYEDLLDFVISLTELAAGADFTQAVAGLPEFFVGSGDKKRYFFFVSDGVTTDPATAVAASEVIDGIDGLKSYAYNSIVPATIYSEMMDNTSSDGIPVIPPTGDRTMASRVLSNITDQIDMNPAHIIRECLVNSVWGLGLPVSAINDASFQAAAQTLFNERFGLSMMWMAQAKIEDFVGEVINHIQAAFYVDPSTGQWTLTLIRDDYDVNTLPVFDQTNCTVESFKRRSPAEVTNQIDVTWTNPLNEQEEVVSAQALGAVVANNGEIVVDSRNYYGVRRAALAAELAARDLAAASAPLATAEIVTNRKGWTLVPGRCLKFTSSEHGADSLVMRVMSVNYGRPGSSQIKVSLTEDVFSYTKPRVVTPPKSVAQNISPIASAPSSIEFLTANRWIAANTLQDGLNVTYPETNNMILVGTTQTDATEVDVYTEGIDQLGNTVLNLTDTFSFIARAVLTTNLSAEATSTGVLFGTYVGDGPKLGGLAILGEDGLPESDHEIALIEAIDSMTGALTLRRGCIDTVPTDWPAGSFIRFISDEQIVVEEALSNAFVGTNYSFRTRTTQGVQSAAAAVQRTYAATERFYAPLRPANVVVQGSAFAPVNLIGYTGSISVTWANRNAVTEDTALLAWTDGSITPEVGQTTTVRLVDDITGVTIIEYTGITGTSYSFASADRGTSNLVRVVVLSVRDGYESIQGHEVLLYFAAFDPALLREATWFDANDIGSMWQDVDATVAVTADSQPVALIQNQRGTIL